MKTSVSEMHDVGDHSLFRESVNPYPLYDPRFEHDACGTGFVASIAGEKSHEIVRHAIRSVCNLTHRGAVAADTQTGDGAGVLTQLPVRFFAEQVAGLASRIESGDDLAVGMFFMPSNEDAYALCRALVEHSVSRHGLGLLRWRKVPVDMAVIGDSSALTAPRCGGNMYHGVVTRWSKMHGGCNLRQTYYEEDRLLWKSGFISLTPPCAMESNHPAVA